VYEAVVDPAQLVVLASTVGAGAFWWCVAGERGLVHPLTHRFFFRLVVVPSERASLAKVKRKGELREYLEDINADETRGLERCAALAATVQAVQISLSDLLSLRRWFYSNWLTAGWFKAASAKRRRAASQEPSVGGSEAPSVVPEEEYTDTDNQPVFLSLDNPLVFTSLLLGGLVLLAALKH
jgi:hypothetical protein